MLCYKQYSSHSLLSPRTKVSCLKIVVHSSHLTRYRFITLHVHVYVHTGDVQSVLSFWQLVCLPVKITQAGNIDSFGTWQSGVHTRDQLLRDQFPKFPSSPNVFLYIYIDNGVLQWQQWVPHERSFECLASLFICMCNFTMDAHSIVELLQPCMHAYCYKSVGGGLRVGKEPHFFAGSTSSGSLWTSYKMHRRNRRLQYQDASFQECKCKDAWDLYHHTQMLQLC